MKICSEELCTGCQLCQNVCGKNAISFVEDERGFIHPLIDEDLCIQCGKCIRSCPINIEYSHEKEPLKVYAAWVKNSNIKKRSTSGGLFYELASKILIQGGVVFGACFDGCKVVHSYCDSIDELSKFQGSKYVQSKIGDSYKHVKSFLKSGKYVLFSGTPCQNAALLSYLGKIDDKKLFLVDIVCHGVPNQNVFDNYIHELSILNKSLINSVRFRVKTPDCCHSSMAYNFSNGKKQIVSFAYDDFYQLFVSNYLIRESCFSCKFANTSRVSDITLADFWGYSPSSFKFRNYMKGVNMVMINTDKGNLLFEEVKGNLVFEERNIAEAIKGNRNLSQPQLKPHDYEAFWFSYSSEKSIIKLSNKFIPNKQTYPPAFKRYLKTYLMTCFPKGFGKVISLCIHFVKRILFKK